MKHESNYNLIYLFISLVIIFTYFFGFYLDENSAGGGKIDFYEHEWGNINLFKNSKLSSALTDLEFRSGRTPLYLILNKFNPFTTDIEEFRRSYFAFAITIPILFFMFLKKKFNNENVGILIFLSSILMLSPYFRTMSFWADQEGLAIFFLLLSLISFNYLSKLSCEINLKKYYFFATLTIILSSLSFYSDQKYIFLSLFIYLTLILENNLKFFIKYSVICTLCAVPAFYLFYIWGGLVPIDTQFRLIFSPSGINYFFSIIGIYLLPIFVVLIIEKKFISLFKNLKIIDLVIFLFLAITLFFALPNEPKFNGVGIVFKFLSLANDKLDINWNLILTTYYIFNLFFLFLVLILFKKTIKNYVFFLVYGLGFMWTYIVYQQYVDPLFFLLIFCYFNFIDEIKIINKKYIYSYFLFYLFLLIGAVYYRSVCSLYFMKAACQVQ